MPVNVVIIIRALCEGFSAQVVHNGQRTQPLNMKTGVRQRLPAISPAGSDRPGLGDQDSLEDLYFADDLILLSHRKQDTRDKTRALEVQGAKVGLKGNAIKTKLMRIVTKRDDGVSVVGGRIEEVDEFTFLYLGSIVSKKESPSEDIQARIGKARQAFSILRSIRRSTALTSKTKLRALGQM